MSEKTSKPQPVGEVTSNVEVASEGLGGSKKTYDEALVSEKGLVS